LQAFLVELRELLVAPLYQRLALGVGLSHDPGGSLNRHAGDGLHEQPGPPWASSSPSRCVRRASKATLASLYPRVCFSSLLFVCVTGIQRSLLGHEHLIAKTFQKFRAFPRASEGLGRSLLIPADLDRRIIKSCAGGQKLRPSPDILSILICGQDLTRPASNSVIKLSNTIVFVHSGKRYSSSK
jgi:hypothetical protein